MPSATVRTHINISLKLHNSYANTMSFLLRGTYFFKNRYRMHTEMEFIE